MPKQNLIYLDSFNSGLFTNRSALTTPHEGGVPLSDVMFDGLNVEVSPRKTLVRRPGFPTYCSATAFGSSEWPLQFWSGRIGGTLYNIVDTQTNVYTFDTTSKTSIYTKSPATAQTYFQQVGNLLFLSNGTTNKQWDGTTVQNNGIVAPTSAPTVGNLNFVDVAGGVQTTHAWSPNYTYNGPASGTDTYFLLDPNNNIQIAFLNPQQTGISGSSAPVWSTTIAGQTIDGTMIWICAGPILAWTAGMSGTEQAFDPSAVQTLSAGPRKPTSYSQSGSTAAWSGTLPANLTADGTGSVTSKTLALVGYGFALPTGSTVTGITLRIRRAAHPLAGSGGGVSDSSVKILKAGTPSGDELAVAGNWPISTTTFTAQVYGGATDLMGLGALTETDINSSTFGVQFIAQFAGTSWRAYLESATLTINYSVGGFTGATTGTVVLDSNGNLQRATTGGTAGGSQPTWDTDIGDTTTDGGITWENIGTGNILSPLVGWRYAYGFHTPFNVGTGGHLSTMSPQLTLAGPIIGNGVTLNGVGSEDTACDRIDLYRNADGGSLLFYDGSSPNVNSATAWSIFDNLADVALDATLVGPIAHLNDPPPTGLVNLTYYQGRMWGSVGNLLYFSAGPDCTNGDGYQSYPPANVFTLSSNITGMAASSQGLVVFTSDQMWMVLGGPQSLTFYIQPVLQQFGILSSNCLVQDADTLFVYTSSRQLFQLTMDGKTEIGFAVADLLQANFAPATSCLALHRSGKDEGLFISNGSTTTMRFSLRTGAWSPTATITGGINIIESVETAAGIYTLLAGTAAGSLKILGRSLTSFLDAAAAYAGYGTFGSFVLSPPGTGTLVAVRRIVLEYAGSLSDLTVSVLPDEVSGSFTSIPFNAADPYQKPATTTTKMRSYDWLGVATPVSAALKHLQVKVTFPSANAADELQGLGIVPHV